MNDQKIDQLASQFLAGDQDSLRQLVVELTRKLIALAYRYTHDWEIARDLTQETWLKVITSIQAYDPERSFRRWLLSIHRNGCISHLRRAAVKREVATPNETLQELAPTTSGQDPLEDLERREFRARLDRALALLSESQRRVFACVDLERMGQAEAARYLGMQFATLRTTLHFARRRLAVILRGLEEAT